MLIKSFNILLQFLGRKHKITQKYYLFSCLCRLTIKALTVCWYLRAVARQSSEGLAEFLEHPQRDFGFLCSFLSLLLFCLFCCWCLLLVFLLCVFFFFLLTLLSLLSDWSFFLASADLSTLKIILDLVVSIFYIIPLLLSYTYSFRLKIGGGV